jgi:hypothetical protein
MSVTVLSQPLAGPAGVCYVARYSVARYSGGSAVATIQMGRRGGSSIAWAISGLALIGAAMFIAAGWLGDAGAADHARFHALSAVVTALVAVAIVTRWPRSGLAAVAPATGLAAYTLAQLVESVGALGYDTVRDTRGDLAVAHDVGITLTVLAMLAVVGGVAAGLAVASARQRGAARVLGGAASLLALGAGLLSIKVLVGM